MYFFDKKTKGFYLKDINQINDSMIEISKEKYQELLIGQSNGLMISIDNKGNPVLIEQAPSKFHEIKNGKWILTESAQSELLIAEKNRLINVIANRADKMKSELLIGYPQAEIDSFYKQEKEALEYKKNKKADTPMLKIIAQTRGVQFELLVEKVIEKSNQFSQAMGAIIGQRQKFEDKILAAESIEDLNIIENEVKSWQFNLES